MTWPTVLLVIALALLPLIAVIWLLGKAMPGMRVLPDWMYPRRKP